MTVSERDPECVWADMNMGIWLHRDQPNRKSRLVKYIREDLATASARADVPGVWTPLTHKDERMTCPMPTDETVVEVMLQDGGVYHAWYSCNLMEAGDWDFVPVDADDEPDLDAESLGGRVIAWRLVSHETAPGDTQDDLPVTDDGQEPVASVVPDHCTGSALVFSEGVLHVSKDGSGYIAVDEKDWALEDDRCEGPEGPEGSVHWITRLPPGEMQALRDFLNGASFAHPALSAIDAKLEGK